MFICDVCEFVWVDIRWVKNYVYCPRSVGLVLLDNAYADNELTVGSSGVHDKMGLVERGVRGGFEGFSEVLVSSSEFLLRGRVDVVFVSRGEGVVEFVEFKPRLGGVSWFQVAGYLLCLRELFVGFEVRGYCYSFKSRRRELFDEGLFDWDEFFRVLGLIRHGLHGDDWGCFPKHGFGVDYCRGCSLFDFCGGV